MSKELIVSSTSLETRLAILEDDQVTEIFVEREKTKGILGNIYKGRVTKVLPGMQAAFVDIGLEKQAFLYVADFLEELSDFEGVPETLEVPAEVTVRKTDAKPAPKKGRRRSRSPRSAERQAASEERETSAAPAELHPAAEPAAPPPKAPEAAPRKIAGPEESGKHEPPTPTKVAGTGRERRRQASRRRPRRRKPPVLAQAPAQKAILPDFLGTGAAVEGRALGLDLEVRSLPVSFSTGSSQADEAPARTEAVIEDQSDRPAFATRTRSSGQGKKRERRPSRSSSLPSISQLLKEGQEILVQVSKEPIGKKGARITSHVALPGRYIVHMPTVDHVGVSRKIPSDKERARLRDIVSRLRPAQGKGFIVRTAGEGRTEEDLAADIGYLTRLWDEVKSKADKKSAPSLVHAEPSLVQRVIRDYVSEDFKAIRVDDELEYQRIINFITTFNPELVSRVRLYTKPRPILEEFGVEVEIEKALKHKVWLKNGGYIVINQTEALVAIDVNTGKFVGRTNSLEDTITQTNLDAVREVVRQIRLRDLGGIIIIDFIDMDESKNRQRVSEALQQELAKDKSPSKILRFNEFGLVALTRKRAKQSLEKVVCQPCIFCSGTGMTKSARTVAYSIPKEARRMAPYFGEGKELLIRCHPEIAKTLRESEREVLAEVREITGKVVTIKSDPLMHIEQFDLVEV